MPITAAQVQADIVSSLEPVDPNGLVLRSITLYWALYADQAAIGPRLQEFYTRLRCIDLLLASYAASVDVSVGEDVAVKQSQITMQLRAMRDAIDLEIQRVEQQVGVQTGPAVAAMTTTAPVSAPYVPRIGPVDGNDPIYRGTVYQPLSWPRG